MSALISRDLMERVIAAAGYTSPARVFTPLVTLWTWIGQLLAERPHCQGAVAGLRAHQAVSGQALCSADTGGYCKARRRIPEAVCWGLQRETAAEAERKAPDEWRWCGRNVQIVDGSVFSLADTAANRAEYPLQRHVRPGLSFPLARALVVFSLAVGVVLEAGALRAPWQVSFQGARDAWHAFAPRLRAMAAPHAWWPALAETIRGRRVGERLDRVEPYTVNRRPKDDPHLHATRQDYKTRAGRRR